MPKQWCIRLTWDYYDREKCEVYLKSFDRVFGALHTGTSKLHSHYYVETEYDNKKLRNDLNRYKLPTKPPKGFKPCSIAELRTSPRVYYDYVCNKEESSEQFNINVDLEQYPEEQKPKKRVQAQTVIERIEAEIDTYMKTPQEVGEQVYDWYLDHAKVLPVEPIFRQVIRTICARHVKNTDPEKHKERRYRIVADILKY